MRIKFFQRQHVLAPSIADKCKIIGSLCDTRSEHSNCRNNCIYSVIYSRTWSARFVPVLIILRINILAFRLEAINYNLRQIKISSLSNYNVRQKSVAGIDLYVFCILLNTTDAVQCLIQRMDEMKLCHLRMQSNSDLLTRRRRSWNKFLMGNVKEVYDWWVDSGISLQFVSMEEKEEDQSGQTRRLLF